MSRDAHRPRRERGFSMIEVLVTTVIVAFGLLSLAGFVTRASAVSVESNQRARALALMEDMAERIRNNKSQAASYASPTEKGVTLTDCSALAGPNRDLCDWGNLLYGSNDAQTNQAATQALRFRGCVTQPIAGQPLYVVTVAWSSLRAGTPPADNCATGAFGDDAYRRVVRTQVRIALLS